MYMHSLQGPSYLTVLPDHSIIDLAYLLGLKVDADLSHNHFYLESITKGTNACLSSFEFPAFNDVIVSVDVFSKILIDIASGMPIKTAFEKQGYTY